MKTYAAINQNQQIREASSSGGVFSVLASQFDVVYGVAMSEDCYEAKMIRVEKDIQPLRGSKYVQAKMGDAFRQVKQDLQAGRSVLFSATGCQINGLALFLGKEYNNLFLLDVVCHGVPSKKLWKSYVQYYESKYGKLESINFRYKDGQNWDNQVHLNQLYIPNHQDSYMRMFLRDHCLRPACYKCQAKRHRKADMTIADFWGIENVVPEMDDGKGASLLITRTDKGQQLFERIQHKLKWQEVSYEEGVKSNPSEYQSVTRPTQRDTFFKDLDELSFEEMKQKYGSNSQISLLKRVFNKIKREIKKVIGRKTKLSLNSQYGMLFTFNKDVK